jgi:hypothetical protein
MANWAPPEYKSRAFLPNLLACVCSIKRTEHNEGDTFNLIQEENLKLYGASRRYLNKYYVESV